jgi:hypothetical protein
MIIKILILVVLAAIVLSLFTGLGFLVRGGDNQSKGMVNALTVRIVLSVLLFILLFVAWHMGLLTPHANIE